jgi:hypothetical protein
MGGSDERIGAMGAGGGIGEREETMTTVGAMRYR